MEYFPTSKWVRFSLINLSVVALAGMIMRYKILFSLPVIQQKNLLHAHSHFAFTAWVSLLLMVLMMNIAVKHTGNPMRGSRTILISFSICSYGMLVAFLLQGYAFFSILFSTCSLLISIVFCIQFFRFLRQHPGFTAARWFKAALTFNILSAAGTTYLAYMMGSGNIDQHRYLASVYWYLHFQYNGWFFFACTGLLLHYLVAKNIKLPHSNTIFILLCSSCVPAYGLSVLWLQLPAWVFSLVAAAAAAQLLGWILLSKGLLRHQLFRESLLTRSFLVCAFLATCIKFILQAGSIFPSLSRLAFGFRPVVIAYLHLILLGMITLFLIGYLFAGKIIPLTRPTRIAATIFLAGVLLNECLLGVQGISAFVYISIPRVHEMLLGAAIILWASTVSLVLSLATRPRKQNSSNIFSP